MKIIELHIPYYSLVITEGDWIFEIYIKVFLNKQFTYSIGVSHKEQEYGKYICSILGKSNKKDPEITFFMNAINRLKLKEADITTVKALYTEIVGKIYDKVAKPINF